jgi:protein-S-isoprenylcysteine O-methyltransferase Ste14
LGIDPATSPGAIVHLALDIAVTVLSLTHVGLQVWATRGHFVGGKIERPAVLLALLVFCTALTYTVLIWTNMQPRAAKTSGLLIEIGALWLFLAAIIASRQARLHFAFDPEVPQSLLQAGPYRVVRHPFYTSYILFWFGWAIATWSLWSVPPLVLLVLFYVAAARFEERRFARTDMAAAYQAYRQRAGLFWPNFSRH